MVYDFIDHVGLDWMDGVEAVACDMNSDFQEAFEEKYPHIQPVFDHFHIIKNFNDKVISQISKDGYWIPTLMGSLRMPRYQYPLAKWRASTTKSKRFAVKLMGYRMIRISSSN